MIPSGGIARQYFSCPLSPNSHYMTNPRNALVLEIPEDYHTFVLWVGIQ